MAEKEYKSSCHRQKKFDRLFLSKVLLHRLSQRKGAGDPRRGCPNNCRRI